MKELGGFQAKKIACADEGTGLEDVVEPFVETVMRDLETAIKQFGAKEIDESYDEVEEKKDDLPLPNNESNSPKHTISNSTSKENEKANVERNENNLSPGLTAILSIAKEHNIIIPEHPPPNSSMPSLTSSMSSCRLIHEGEDSNSNTIELATADDERVSILSGSSLSHGCFYNKQNPYSSTVLDARYLTKTSTSPLSKALNKSSSCSMAVDKYEKMQNELTIGFDINKNQKDAKRVIEMTLSLPEDYSIEYEPGDSIGMLVTNEHTSSFRTIIKILQKNQKFGDKKQLNVHEQLVSLDDGNPITVYEAIAKHVDITSIVKKRILARLAQLCNDNNNQESIVLSLLASKTKEGDLLYNEFVIKYALNIGHILELFPSCQPNVQDILGICDGMVPRYYSISSSPLKANDRLTIAFSVVDYYLQTNDDDFPSSLKTIVSNRRAGLATQFLEIISASLLCENNSETIAKTKISIFPKPTTDFRLPKSLSTPLILVGPGTGVAPFLGFLSHRECLMKEKKALEAQAEQGTWRGGFEIEEENHEGNEKKLNAISGSDTKTSLFFGCRWPDHDFLFKNELEQFVANKTLTSLHTAFSRVQNERKYVQHEMEAVGNEIMDMVIKGNASIYVCGDGNAMGKDVQDCVASILEKHSDHVSDGKAYIEEMKKKHKFVLDIWS